MENSETMADAYESPMSIGDLYRHYGDNGIPPMEINELSDQSNMRSSIGRRPDISDLIQELMDEWLNRALERSNIALSFV